MTADESSDSRMTADSETIRKWAQEYELVPVRQTSSKTTAGDQHPYEFQPETSLTESMEALSWDEFHDEVEENDLVVTYHGEGTEQPLEVIDRERAVRQGNLEREEMEERLLAGETITSEVTDTKVIERTIVDHATIESDLVETEVLDSRVVDAELRSREIGGCDVVDRHTLNEVDKNRFEDMDQLTEGFHETLSHPVAVEVDVEENWTVTRELLERATIESRIVDVDVTEFDEVESESYRDTFEIEGIQQILLKSDVIDHETNPDDVIRSGTIQSEFQEDDVVRTHLNQLRVVEDDVFERKVIRGELTESELRQVDVLESTPIETSFVDSETLEGEITPVGMTDDQTETEHAEEIRTRLTEEDEGKPVVSPGGEAVGMVEEVRGETAYINPEPGLVDRIRSKLGWGDADEDDYAIDEDNIARITDDEVELSVSK